VQLQSPFAAVTPTVDGDVLQVLAQAQRPFTLPAIKSLIPSRSRSGIGRVLDRLALQGLVVVDDRNSVRTFRLNHDHLLAEYIDGIGWARERFLERLREECAAMPVVYAALFGSAARGAMQPDSDIDLFFAVDADERHEAEERIFDLATAAQRWTGNTTNPVIYDAASIRADDPLIKSIESEGLPLTADRRWLASHLRKARR
jgi:predicted nucleotidyltransferase